MSRGGSDLPQPPRGRGLVGSRGGRGGIGGALHDEEQRTGEPSGDLVDHSRTLDGESKYLLILSKAFTGNGDICTAIYKDTQGNYLVSNNSGDPAHIDRVMSVLSTYDSSDPRRTASARGELLSILSATPQAAPANPMDALRAQSAARTVGAAAAPMPQEHLTTSVDPAISRYVDVLLDPRNFKAFGERFVRGEPRYIDVEERGVHAEMRLLPHAIADHQRARQRTEPAAAPELDEAPMLTEGATGSIITSKLMCYPCYETIQTVYEQQGIDIPAVGTHGKSYPAWEYPRELGRTVLEATDVRLVAQVARLRELPDAERRRGLPSDTPQFLNDVGHGALGRDVSFPEAVEYDRIARDRQTFPELSSTVLESEHRATEAMPSSAVIRARVSIMRQRFEERSDHNSTISTARSVSRGRGGTEQRTDRGSEGGRGGYR